MYILVKFQYFFKVLKNDFNIQYFFNTMRESIQSIKSEIKCTWMMLFSEIAFILNYIIN